MKSISQKYSVRWIYYSGLGVLFAILVLMLLYLRLRENDSFSSSSSTAGYISAEEYADLAPGSNAAIMEKDGESYVLFAEGNEQIYLYSGDYELIICAKTTAEDAFYQVVDLGTNSILAEHVYTLGEEYHVVRFSIGENCEDVVVRSYVNEAEQDTASTEIYGYTLSSDGYVCNDAKWEILAVLLMLVMTGAGIYRWLSRGRIAMLALTVLTAITSLPFVSGELQSMQDMTFHMARIYSLGAAISEGALPQRLLSLGGSTIIPVMYPEILLYGAGFMVAFGSTVLLAFQMVYVVITGLTAFLAYGAARIAVDEKSSLLFAAIYSLNPFRLNELLIRAAIGEAFAMSFLPLIAAGMWLILCGKDNRQIRKGAGCLILGYTGLLSSHIVTGVLAAVFCAAFVLLRMLLHPVEFFRQFRRIFYLAGAAIVTILLNLWFLVPFLQFYRWDFYISGSSGTFLESNAVRVWDLFIQEIYVKKEGRSIRTSNKTLGPAVLIGMLLFLGMFLSDIRFLSGKKRNSNYDNIPDRNGSDASADLMKNTSFDKTEGPSDTGSSVEIRRKWLQETERAMGGQALLIACIALFMCTELFPWKWLSEHIALISMTLARIQFPWRLLTIASLMCSILLVIVFRALHRSSDKTAMLLSAVLATMYLFTAVQTGTDYYLLNEPLGKFDNGAAYFTDYTLASADYLTSAAWTEAGFGPEITVDASSETANAALSDSADDESNRGAAIITDYHSDGTDYVFSFENTTGMDITVTVPVYWYGLHTAYYSSGDSKISGTEETPASSASESSGDEEKRMVSSSMNEEYQFTDILIPAEMTSGTVELIYEEPQSWKYAEWVSMITVLALALLTARKFFLKKSHP